MNEIFSFNSFEIDDVALSLRMVGWFRLVVTALLTSTTLSYVEPG